MFWSRIIQPHFSPLPRLERTGMPWPKPYIPECLPGLSTISTRVQIQVKILVAFWEFSIFSDSRISPWIHLSSFASIIQMRNFTSSSTIMCLHWSRKLWVSFTKLSVKSIVCEYLFLSFQLIVVCEYLLPSLQFKVSFYCDNLQDCFFWKNSEKELSFWDAGYFFCSQLPARPCETVIVYFRLYHIS